MSGEVAVMQRMEAEPVNEMRGAFGVPARLSVEALWAVVRGPARTICAGAGPASGRRPPFAAFLEAARKAWRRADPPPTDGEASFLAALCGPAGLDSRTDDDQAGRIGRFVYAFLRMVNFSGSFPRITTVDLDRLQFSMHLEMLPAGAGPREVPVESGAGAKRNSQGAWIARSSGSSGNSGRNADDRRNEQGGAADAGSRAERGHEHRISVR